MFRSSRSARSNQTRQALLPGARTPQNHCRKRRIRERDITMQYPLWLLVPQLRARISPFRIHGHDGAKQCRGRTRGYHRCTRRADGLSVYLLGEVGKPGGYVLGSGANGITVLRVVAAVGGPGRDASLGGTKMLRKTEKHQMSSNRFQFPLRRSCAQKAQDVPLQPGDIIFILAVGLEKF
jgi:hypothetical protein